MHCIQCAQCLHIVSIIGTVCIDCTRCAHTQREIAREGESVAQKLPNGFELFWRGSFCRFLVDSLKMHVLFMLYWFFLTHEPLFCAYTQKIDSAASRNRTPELSRAGLPSQSHGRPCIASWRAVAAAWFFCVYMLFLCVKTCRWLSFLQEWGATVALTHKKSNQRLWPNRTLGRPANDFAHAGMVAYGILWNPCRSALISLCVSNLFVCKHKKVVHLGIFRDI